MSCLYYCDVTKLTTVLAKKNNHTAITEAKIALNLGHWSFFISIIKQHLESVVTDDSMLKLGHIIHFFAAHVLQSCACITNVTLPKTEKH